MQTDFEEKLRLYDLLQEKERRKGERNDIYETYRNFKGRYAVLIGGSGSGKSYEIADRQIDRLMNEDNHRILCCRDQQKQITESQVPLIKSRIEIRSDVDLWKMNMSKGHESFTYIPNGNKFIFWGLDNVSKLKSIFDITSIWIEEADQTSAAALRELDRRLRGYEGKNKDGSDKFMQISFSFNPVHETSWLNTRFFNYKEENQIMIHGQQYFTDCQPFANLIVPDIEEKIEVYDIKLKKMVTKYKHNTLITHSTYLDNAFIGDEYSRILQSMQKEEPEEYNVYALGQWGVYGSMYFKEFRKDVHVVEPFIIPMHWQRFRVMDYGLDMLAAYWVAINTEGHAFVYKEIYQPDLIISDAADRMKKATNNASEVIKATYAPGDLWNRRQETGKSASDIFRENGIGLTKAENDRSHGWLNLKEWLKPYVTKDEQTGMPVITARLKIFSNCANLIRTLPQLQRDEKDPTDVATEPHELTHGPDALRYFCGMRVLPSVTPQTPKQTHFNSEKPRHNSHSGSNIDQSYITGGFDQ